jgi:predicted nucleotidyltransferase
VPEPESDLDLAVLATPARRVAVPDVLAALAPAFPGADLDVAILNDADPVFLDEVFRCPDLLFGDPDLFAEREAHAYRFFMESADLRAHERALSADKLARLLDAAA